MLTKQLGTITESTATQQYVVKVEEGVVIPLCVKEWVLIIVLGGGIGFGAGFIIDTFNAGTSTKKLPETVTARETVRSQNGIIITPEYELNELVSRTNNLTADIRSATTLNELIAVSKRTNNITADVKVMVLEMKAEAEVTGKRSEALIAMEEKIKALELELGVAKAEINSLKKCNSDLFESLINKNLDKKKLASLEKSGNTKKHLAYLTRVIARIKGGYSAAMRKFGCPNNDNLELFIAFLERQSNILMQKLRKEAKENSKFSKFLSHPMVNTLMGVALAQVPVIVQKINKEGGSKAKEEKTKPEISNKTTAPAESKEETAEIKRPPVKEEAQKNSTSKAISR